jgi:hypothetical protein
MIRQDAIGRGSLVSTIGFIMLLVGASRMAQAAETYASPPFAIEAAQELATSRPSLSLDGEWDFSYDPKEVGEKEQWFLPGAAALKEKTTVPGCVQAAHHPSSGMSEADYAEFHKKHGELMMDVRWPTLSASWQRKPFTVPAEWKNRDVWLHFGGLNPAAEFWLNGKKLGSTLTSRCLIRINITPQVRFGEENVLVVRVYWPDGPRMDGLFNYFAGFSGLYRSVRVESVPRACIKDLHVVGRINPRRATVHFTVAGLGQQPGQLHATCKIAGKDGQKEIRAEMLLAAAASGESEQQFEIDMPDAKLWSPDEPNLYTASVSIHDGQEPAPRDAASVRFGLREIRTEGLRILLNGQPIFVRGASDIHVYPETISPSTSKAFFVDRIRKTKRFGFNYTKSCMEVYTPEFLDAADEVGFLVCQEMPTGLTGKYRTTIREKMPADYIDVYRREVANIVRSDRMHPSVILYSMISEFTLKKNMFSFYCQELPTAVKKLNPQALVVDITCGGGWQSKTKLGTRVTDIIEDTAGYQFTQEPLSHPIEGEYDKLDRPFLLHEYNWWTSLPEISLKDRYANLPYKLNGGPEMEASAAKSGLSDQIPTFVDRSRRLKYEIQKCGLELARRNPKISGYHFWLIQGLSWCQEGIMNEFYDDPGDAVAEEFRRINGATALLLDDGNHRDFERGKPAALGIEVSHFGPRKLDKPSVTWRLMEKEKVVGEGTVSLEPIACGSLTASKPLAITMPAGAEPAMLELRVRLVNDDAEICDNRWKLWTLPASKGGPWTSRIATDLPFVAKAYKVRQLAVPLNADSLKLPVVVTSKLNPTLVDYLEQGGRVVLFSAGSIRDSRPGAEYRPGERIEKEWLATCDIYRTTPWNQGRFGNMGTVMVDHPALGGLPHEGWCDINFVHLIHGVFPILLENLRPPQIDPIIRSIGHKNTMIDRAYLFEVKLGRGALLATSLKLADTYDTHPQTRYMVESMLKYACGDRFQPKAGIARDRLVAAIRTE